ncbi:GTP-binding protein HflX [Lentilactobacillus farraginis DSM 18382 = JCM 14108]|uniref:GTP-binding protein HflX n=1 Tax=Lentilactobacillus farraginis DSM 18382 = JCM 14108 TaxID=1423743 RepID=X0PKG4_9LACO|nr:GTP-binding protein HflX [Lentilactobacillus farraginis DSM 18382 = JCM 14108]
MSLLIPFDKGDVVSYLNDNTNILKTDYRDNGTVITAELNDVDAKRFGKYVLAAE